MFPIVATATTFNEMSPGRQFATIMIVFIGLAFLGLILYKIHQPGPPSFRYYSFDSGRWETYRYPKRVIRRKSHSHREAGTALERMAYENGSMKN